MPEISFFAISFLLILGRRRSGLGGPAQLTHNLVHIAPGPALSRLDGANDRMLGLLKVLGCVLVLGGVTAAHVAALRAQTQVDPSVPHLNTLLAHVHIG